MKVQTITPAQIHQSALRATKAIRDNNTPALKNMNKRHHQLVDQLRRGKIPKWQEITEYADSVNAAMSPYSACERGCAHCCHIAVSVSTREAELITQATGIAHNSPKTVAFSDMSQLDAVARYTGTPCPFLNPDQTCSIYAVRPVACRTYFNLSAYPSLCDVRIGIQEVPNFNTKLILTAIHHRSFVDQQTWADIRDFFSFDK